jgi:hypothetical protein
MPFRTNNHGDTQDRVVSNVVDAALSNVTDSIIDTHSALKVLVITVTAEIGLLTMLFVAKPEFIEEYEPDIWMYAAIAFFLIGFLTAFAMYRMIARKWIHRNSGIYIWLVSIAAAIANVFLLFAILVAMP